MVTLKTKTGHSYKTTTVGEMIDLLRQFDESLPVLATWEGTYCPIDSSILAVEPHGLIGERPDALIVNVG